MRRESLGNDHYMLLDVSEIGALAEKHVGWMSRQISEHNLPTPVGEFVRRVSVGDESLVEKSDDFLRKIEDQVPMSKGWRNVDDVVGAIPNVPSYLAGHPQCMRRRERVARDNAPLTIFMDLTSSYSISQHDVLMRGVVLLALTRLLVEHRAVELWVGTSMADRWLQNGVSGTVAWRIDTTPLDLARSAYHVCSPSMSRMFGYGVANAMVDRHLVGYLNDFYDRRVDGLKQVAGWQEILLIPRISIYDPMVQDPVGWIRRVMQQYVPQEDAA